MGSFVPSTLEERKEMLEAVGVKSYDELYKDVPESIRLGENGLKLEDGVSELEALSKMEALAKKNHAFKAVFRGAGSYHHYIPAIVKAILQTKRRSLDMDKNSKRFR